MVLGEIISIYRTKHGISMETFADYCKLSKGYISMLEKNENPSSGKPIVPSLNTLKKIASGMSVDLNYLLAMLDENQKISIYDETDKNIPAPKAIKIPVLGRVVAGVPLEAITDILDYEEISVDMARTGEYFALKIKGDSMSPQICEDDIVIVRKQEAVECGEVAIILVNGEEATVKKVVFHENGITLIGNNAFVYSPHFYTCDEVEKLPISIIGRVVEIRRTI